RAHRLCGPMQQLAALLHRRRLRARVAEGESGLEPALRARAARGHGASGRRRARAMMEIEMSFPLEGGCDCKQVRYRMETKPLFVHCCHCRWCQRETGASFALNAMIESDRLCVLAAKPELVDTPSQSGMGQQIARCPKCRI